MTVAVHRPEHRTVRDARGRQPNVQRLDRADGTTGVTVLGTAADGDWFRIARGGKALGYVYAPLIAPR